jgi:nucleoside-diphosphate-sugar epimerase
MNILVTGASGFIGSGVCRSFNAYGLSVCACSRHTTDLIPSIKSNVVESYSSPALLNLIYKVDSVLHLAGRAHIMNETVSDPLSAFVEANVTETLNLARMAANANVRRFVFVSSIKVNGEATRLDTPFSEKDLPRPIDAYGLSKHNAELGLMQISHDTGMEVVIVRPPLVYGRGVKGNFRSLMNLVYRRIPLPLALINDNSRSLVSLENLVDFLALCVLHPKASGHTFLISDQHDISTAELIRRLSFAMGLPQKIFPVPRFLLSSAACIAGKRSAYLRLTESLVVDSTFATRLLGWVPLIGLDAGLSNAVIDFKS